MLSAVHATKERLIAHRYMIQISVHLAFFYTKRELFTLQSTCCHIIDASQSESDLHLFFAHKNTIMARCSFREDFSSNVTVFNVYK